MKLIANVLLVLSLSAKILEHEFQPIYHDYLKWSWQFISFRSLLNFNCQRFLRNPRFPILWPCTKDFFPSSQLLLSQKPLDKALTRSVLRIREGTLVVPPPYSLPPSHSFPSQSNNVMSNANTPPRSFYRRHLPAHLVDLNSAEGKSRFRTALNAGNAESFFPLVSQFQTQSHPSMCGLTTLSIILNALGIDPQRVWNHPWRWFAESLLDCCLSMDAVKVSGITMDQLACTAGCQGLLVGTWRGLGIDETRELIRKSVCGRADGSFEFVVASYDRKSLGQTGSGHFSPVAAYDDISDSVLILDVARFKLSAFFPLKYGPHWIQLQDLVEATKPIDKSSGLPRGFLSFGKSSENTGFKRLESCKATKKCTETASGYAEENSKPLSPSP